MTEEQAIPSWDMGESVLRGRAPLASTSREIDAFKSRPARKPDCVSPFEDDGVSDMSIPRVGIL
jgi:hypothetical protein